GLVVTVERGAIIAKRTIPNVFRALVSNSRTFALDCTRQTGAVVYVFDMDSNKLAMRTFRNSRPTFVQDGRHCVWLDHDLKHGRHFAFDLGPDRGYWSS